MAETAAPRPVTVLVADADPSVRERVRASAPAGWRVIEAGSGAAARRAAAAEPVDLAVVGVPLPDAGIELCRELGPRDRGAPLLPILVLVADEARVPREAALEAGADDVLSKGADPGELAVRLRVLERLREHEREALDQEDELSALVAHDLRNPLSAAVGILGMLRKEAIDPALREDLGTAFAGVARARDILDDVLRARMLEIGAIGAVRKDRDLADLAAAAARSQADEAAEVGVELRLPVPPGPRLAVDPDLVRRAIENLVVNAVRHARRGTAVEVSVSAVEGGAAVEVADRGQPIPDALKKTVFERFGSVTAARRAARRGHGVALHLVALVAAAHGGTVEAIDREGGGNLFRLTLPGAR